jgi:hypothetical protein
VQQFQSIDPRQIDIEEYDIGPSLLARLKLGRSRPGALAIGYDVHLGINRMLGQRRPNQIHICRIIFDY